MAIVINEVDYDQSGPSEASFIEVFNSGPSAVSLAGLAIVLVDGTGGGGGTQYLRIDLSAAGASLAAGQYLLITNTATVADIPPEALSIQLTGDFIRKGPRDGIALIDTNGTTPTVLDAFSYEGQVTAAIIPGFADPVNLVEGTAFPESDINNAPASLSRKIDGEDTDNAIVDWGRISVPTPGRSNNPPVDLVVEVMGNVPGELGVGTSATEHFVGVALDDVTRPYKLVSYADSLAGVTVDLFTNSSSANTATGGLAQGDWFTSINALLGSELGDSLRGSAGSSYLIGGGGDDELIGRSDSLFNLTDYLYGGTGNDGLYGGAGHDELVGGADQDFLLGNLGNDTLWGGNLGSLDDTANNTLVGGRGNDWIYGGAATDALYGDDGADTLNGGGGLDNLFGGIGGALDLDTSSDFLFGGGGGDNLYGFGGTDTLNGDDGDDGLYGGDGGDTLAGGLGLDFVMGEGGDDVMWGDVAGSTTETSNNTLVGVDGNDTMHGAAGTDSLFGDNGDDLLNGNGGIDHLEGGNDRDALGNDVAAGNDTLNGGDGGDNLYGLRGVDELNGGNDGDGLYGGDGGDTLHGDGGDDYILGENGDDLLHGDLGNDVLVGGAGTDRYFFGSGWGHDQIHGFENGVETIDMTGVAGLSSFAQLTVVASNSSSLVYFGSDSLFLLGIAPNQVTAANFQFATQA